MEGHTISVSINTTLRSRNLFPFPDKRINKNHKERKYVYLTYYAPKPGK